MKRGIRLLTLLSVLLSQAAIADAQSTIVTIRLTKDQIGIVKTAPGITTRLVFLEQVNDIICGDLYDPVSGRGSFVVQRGGKDVFLKPVATKGVSNLFVKTGDNDEHVYSFDLSIVAVDQAYRIVNVLDIRNVPVADTRNVPVSTTRTQGPPMRMTPPFLPSVDLRSMIPVSSNVWGSYELPGGTDLPEPPRPAETVTRTSGRVFIQGAAIRRPEPQYPSYARAAGLDGDVVVEIVVDEGGKVIAAKPISGPGLFRQAAVNAALDWRFNPTKVDGVPTEAVGSITFRFRRFPGDRNVTGKIVDSNSGDPNRRKP